MTRSSPIELRSLTDGLDRPADQAQALFRFVEQDIDQRTEHCRHQLRRCRVLEAGGRRLGREGPASRRAVSQLRYSRPARNRTDAYQGRRAVAPRLGRGLAPRSLAAHVPVLSPFRPCAADVPRVRLWRLAARSRPERPGIELRVSRCSTAGECRSGPDRVLAHQLFTRMSLHALPPAEQRLAEFLLLLPVAALIICVFRNMIGIASFGTFGPALVGLVFRDIGSIAGIIIFVGLIVTGWRFRRLLDRFHLLQVPRTALMLSLVVCMLIGLIAVASHYQYAVSKYVSLFPVIILTGMIERFWTLEEEDGARSSFRTLIGTLVIAAAVAMVVSASWLSAALGQYPEALGLVMAGQLLLGRYTGLPSGGVVSLP